MTNNLILIRGVVNKTYIRAKNFDADKPRAFKSLESAKPKYKLKVRDIVLTEDWEYDGMMEDDESIGDDAWDFFAVRDDDVLPVTNEL